MMFRLYPALQNAIFEDVCFEKNGQVVVKTLVHPKGFVEIESPERPYFAKYGRHLLAEFGEVRTIEDKSVTEVEWGYHRVPDTDLPALQALVEHGGEEALRDAGFVLGQTDVWIEAPLERIEDCSNSSSTAP